MLSHFWVVHIKHSLQSRAVDKSREENGSSVNYESAVSKIAIMPLMKLDRSMPFSHAHVGQQRSELKGIWRRNKRIKPKQIDTEIGYGLQIHLIFRERIYVYKHYIPDVRSLRACFKATVEPLEFKTYNNLQVTTVLVELVPLFPKS